MARHDWRQVGWVAALLVGSPGWAHERPEFAGSGCGEAMDIAASTTETAPVLDGSLSDGEWDGAAQCGGFSRTYPDRGVPATLPTTVHLLTGHGRLYVAFECGIAAASKVRATETREDARLSDQDRVEVLIDTLHDHRRTTDLQANAGGGRRDRRWGNDEWDAVWEVAGAVHEEAFVVEMAIDLASLTYEKGQDGTVGINFTRRTIEPYEDSAWLVDATGGEEDPHCFAHLTGLTFPEQSAKREVEVDLFTVATADFEDDGEGFELDAGLDIEWPLTTSVTSRFTVFPDLSNVEAAFETIDVSYREQFLPDTRDFFTRQSEYFGSSSLFHSRRIEQFDVGAKLTGTHGPYRVGLLDAWDSAASRNDFVGHVTRQLGQHQDISLSLVDVRQPGLDNTTFGVGYGTRFSEESPFRASASWAQSLSSDPLREGHRANAELSLNRGPGKLGTHWWYGEVSPRFDPIDGFNPRQGFRRIGGVVWKEWVPKEGTKPFSSLELFASVHRGWAWNGGFYSEGINNGLIIAINNRDRLVFTRIRDRHLEAHIRPEPFADTTYNVSGRWGRGREISGNGYFRWGTVEDSRMRQYGLNVDWQPNSSLRGSISYARRRQRFLDGSRGGAQTIEVGATKILNPENWLSVRWYSRSGDTDIKNLNLVYRMHQESGKEFYVILGDPLAEDIRARIAVKYVHPIRF